MLSKKRGQSTAEYAVLIALVIGAAIAMQTYVKRGLQGRTHGASNRYFNEVTANASSGWDQISNIPVTGSMQYEPGELESRSTQTVSEQTANTTIQTGGKVDRTSNQTTQQQAGDYQKRTY